MTEYLDKQAVSEWLKTESKNTTYERIVRDTITTILVRFQSGAFDAPEHPVIQAIRDFMPTSEEENGYNALVAWLEATTPFVLDPTRDGGGNDEP